MRPRVLLNCAASLDGRLDDATPRRLVLSGPQDLDRVDALRASVDAVLVGAGTVRADDPRLLVRSPDRRAYRLAAGRRADPLKVTLTRSGALDPGSRFFTTGDQQASARVVYAAPAAVPALRATVGSVSDVVALPDPAAAPDGLLGALLQDLGSRGVRRLLVEGGGEVLTMFFAAGLVEEFSVFVAPFLIGDPAAPRMFGDGVFGCGPNAPMRLVGLERCDDGVVMRYLTGPARPPGTPDSDEHWLARAIELAAECPRSESAFSVGAVVVAADGTVLGEGFSRQDGVADHAEEAALRPLAGHPELAGATVYSSLEPCSARASRPRTCSELIVAAGVRRVVMAWREPPLFVEGEGAAMLSRAGVEVVELAAFADAAKAPNRHLLAR